MKHIAFSLLLLSCASVVSAQVVNEDTNAPQGGTNLTDAQVIIENTGSSVEVTISNYNGEAVVTIYDEDGNVVTSESVNVEGNAEVEQSVEAVEPGNYTVNVETEEGAVSEEIIVY